MSLLFQVHEHHPVHPVPVLSADDVSLIQSEESSFFSTALAQFIASGGHDGTDSVSSQRNSNTEPISERKKYFEAYSSLKSPSFFKRAFLQVASLVSLVSRFRDRSPETTTPKWIDIIAQTNGQNAMLVLPHGFQILVPVSTMEVSSPAQQYANTSDIGIDEVDAPLLQQDPSSVNVGRSSGGGDGREPSSDSRFVAIVHRENLHQRTYTFPPEHHYAPFRSYLYSSRTVVFMFTHRVIAYDIHVGEARHESIKEQWRWNAFLDGYRLVAMCSAECFDQQQGFLVATDKRRLFKLDAHGHVIPVSFDVDLLWYHSSKILLLCASRRGMLAIASKRDISVWTPGTLVQYPFSPSMNFSYTVHVPAPIKRISVDETSGNLVVLTMDGQLKMYDTSTKSFTLMDSDGVDDFCVVFGTSIVYSKAGKLLVRDPQLNSLVEIETTGRPFVLADSHSSVRSEDSSHFMWLLGSLESGNVLAERIDRHTPISLLDVLLKSGSYEASLALCRKYDVDEEPVHQAIITQTSLRIEGVATRVLTMDHISSLRKLRNEKLVSRFLLESVGSSLDSENAILSLARERRVRYPNESQLRDTLRILLSAVGDHVSSSNSYPEGIMGVFADVFVLLQHGKSWCEAFARVLMNRQEFAVLRKLVSEFPDAIPVIVNHILPNDQMNDWVDLLDSAARESIAVRWARDWSSVFLASFLVDPTSSFFRPFQILRILAIRFPSLELDQLNALDEWKLVDMYVERTLSGLLAVPELLVHLQHGEVALFEYLKSDITLVNSLVMHTHFPAILAKFGTFLSFDGLQHLIVDTIASLSDSKLETYLLEANNIIEVVGDDDLAASARRKIARAQLRKRVSGARWASDWEVIVQEAQRLTLLHCRSPAGDQADAEWKCLVKLWQTVIAGCAVSPLPVKGSLLQDSTWKHLLQSLEAAEAAVLFSSLYPSLHFHQLNNHTGMTAERQEENEAGAEGAEEDDEKDESPHNLEYWNAVADRRFALLNCPTSVLGTIAIPEASSSDHTVGEIVGNLVRNDRISEADVLRLTNSLEYIDFGPAFFEHIVSSCPASEQAIMQYRKRLQLLSPIGWQSLTDEGLLKCLSRVSGDELRKRIDKAGVVGARIASGWSSSRVFAIAAISTNDSHWIAEIKDARELCRVLEECFRDLSPERAALASTVCSIEKKLDAKTIRPMICPGDSPIERHASSLVLAMLAQEDCTNHLVQLARASAWEWIVCVLQPSSIISDCRAVVQACAPCFLLTCYLVLLPYDASFLPDVVRLVKDHGKQRWIPATSQMIVDRTSVLQDEEVDVDVVLRIHGDVASFPRLSSRAHHQLLEGRNASIAHIFEDDGV
eukprot:ANDGO_05449.mRNA.1 hypothetical protein